jgi:hypothetical protein
VLPTIKDTLRTFANRAMLSTVLQLGETMLSQISVHKSLAGVYAPQTLAQHNCQGCLRD